MILSWNLQRNEAVIPKSVHRERMLDNFGALKVHLTDVQVKKIALLDLKRPQMVDTLKPSEVKRLYNYVNNPVLTSL